MLLILVLFMSCPSLSQASTFSLHEDVLGEDYKLEIEVSPSVSTQAVTINLGGGRPKPGEKPKVNVLGIDVPAMLVETGFLSNSKDEQILKSPAQRQKIAELMANEIAFLMKTSSAKTRSAPAVCWKSA